MKNYQEWRCLVLASYIVATPATIRETAKKFGVSRSTVHKDVTKRVEKVNPILAQEVKRQLAINKYNGVVKGGIAAQAKRKLLRELNKNS